MTWVIAVATFWLGYWAGVNAETRRRERERFVRQIRGVPLFALALLSALWVAPAFALAQVVWPGGCITQVAAGQIVYCPLGSSDTSANHAEQQTPLRSATTATAIDCSVDIAPGTGESVRVTFQAGACGTVLADSSLAVSCLISGTNKTASDTGSFGVSAGECVNTKVTYSAGATTSVPRYAVELN